MNAERFWIIAAIANAVLVLGIDIYVSVRLGPDQTLSWYIHQWAMHWPWLKLVYLLGGVFLYWHLFGSEK